MSLQTWESINPIHLTKSEHYLAWFFFTFYKKKSTKKILKKILKKKIPYYYVFDLTITFEIFGGIN